MNSKKVYIAILIELIAITLFFKLESAMNSILVYSFFHFLSSIVMAWALSIFFVTFKKFRNFRIEISLILTFLIFITSFFGIIFSIILAFYLQTIDIKEKKEVKAIGLDSKYIKLPVTRRNFGEGAIYNISSANPQFKLNVLTYIVKNNMPNKGNVLKEALSDNNDEVRLMAFSVLSREEDKLNKAIFKKLEELKTAKDKSKIYKELGKLYWEFIYLGIVDENLKEFYLNLAKENFEKSKDDIESRLYLGRIYLREKNIQKAKEMLESIIDKEKKAIPYLAEVYFYEGNIKKVKKLMKELDLLSVNLNFYFNYRVWVES